jgi:GNAT superfamily N-acetyltransferase
MIQEWQRSEYSISTDVNQLDLTVIHQFLANTYWAKDIPFTVLQHSIQNSLVFGLYKDKQQIGFGRVITDYSTFAYIADVFVLFVLESFRGEGLGKWLIETIISHPELRGLRRWLLVTKDAHELYQKVSFNEIKNPSRFMEIVDLDVYKKTFN